jgi:hypothetical protein
MQSQKALELIGKRIQEQYERWQARVRLFSPLSALPLLSHTRTLLGTIQAMLRPHSGGSEEIMPFNSPQRQR